MSQPKIYAFLAVLGLFLLGGLYVREYTFLFNSIGVKGLVAGSIIIALAAAGTGLWIKRDRFTPWKRHVPEILLVLFFSVVYAPLFGSLLNRAFSLKEYQSFEFVSEVPYFASGYGMLKGEKLEPTGYYLTVKERGQLHRFKYKSQAYYPVTKPGERVLLPIRRGIFGVRVMLLR